MTVQSNNIANMLTPAQLALCQADAIARLARLRQCAHVRLTELGHLALEQHSSPTGQSLRQWVSDTTGPYSSNLARVLRWENSLLHH